MSNITHDLKIVDNVFVKMMVCPNVGDIIQGHAHMFDHITLLATGSVKMLSNETESVYKAPHLIVTPKGVMHQFIAKEPQTTLCCIHAIREGDEMEDIAPQNITEKQALDLIGQFPLIKI